MLNPGRYHNNRADSTAHCQPFRRNFCAHFLVHPEVREPASVLLITLDDLDATAMRLDAARGDPCICRISYFYLTAGRIFLSPNVGHATGAGIGTTDVIAVRFELILFPYGLSDACPRSAELSEFDWLGTLAQLKPPVPLRVVIKPPADLFVAFVAATNSEATADDFRSAPKSRKKGVEVL